MVVKLHVLHFCSLRLQLSYYWCVLYLIDWYQNHWIDSLIETFSQYVSYYFISSNKLLSSSTAKSQFWPWIQKARNVQKENITDQSQISLHRKYNKTARSCWNVRMYTTEMRCRNSKLEFQIAAKAYLELLVYSFVSTNWISVFYWECRDCWTVHPVFTNRAAGIGLRFWREFKFRIRCKIEIFVVQIAMKSIVCTVTTQTKSESPTSTTPERLTLTFPNFSADP